jgi:hypothetical protein
LFSFSVAARQRLKPLTELASTCSSEKQSKCEMKRNEGKETTVQTERTMAEGDSALVDSGNVSKEKPKCNRQAPRVVDVAVETNTNKGALGESI